MKYLGYEWENQVSMLASRITLYLNKEIKLSFLSSATVKAVGEYDKEPQEYPLCGFVLSRYTIPMDVAEQMIADLKCIHINKRDSYSEVCFVVCAYPSILQAWYNMMWEGTVSMKVMRELGGCDAMCKAPVEELDRLTKIYEEKTVRYYV